jgi:hypothetical protein
VNAGYGFDVGNNDNANGPFAAGGGNTTPPGVFTAATTVFPAAARNRDGFVGGGQIGYNYQIGGFVIGIEADGQYADLQSNRSAVTGFGAGSGPRAPFIGFAPAGGNRAGIEWFGTVRGPSRFRHGSCTRVRHRRFRLRRRTGRVQLRDRNSLPSRVALVAAPAGTTSGPAGRLALASSTPSRRT